MFFRIGSILFLFLSISNRPTAFAQTASGYKIKINQHPIPCSGKPVILYRQAIFSNYGTAPQITIKPDLTTKNGYCIAWLDPDSSRIKISVISEDHKLVKEIVPDYFGKTDYLGGFAVLPGNRYAVGYTKDNAHGDQAFEYWVTLMDEAGNSIFNQRIFGDRPSEELNAKGAPVGHSSARMEYDTVSGSIYFYLGHTQKYSDGLRHQGGYLGKLDQKGALTEINTWYCSHNFDQRLIVEDGTAYTMYHGDAYPRALGVGIVHTDDRWKWNKISKINFFEIEGQTGNNFTGAKIGHLVYQGPKQLGVTFCTRQNKKNYGVGYCPIRYSKGNLVAGNVTWLKTEPNKDAGLPQCALRARGRNLVAFMEFSGTHSSWTSDPEGQTSVFYEVSNSGTILNGPMSVDSVQLQLMHDMVRLPNGNVLWAVADYQVSATERRYSFETNTINRQRFIVYEIDMLENNRNLYESYDQNLYEKTYFSDSNGGFVVNNVDLKKNKKSMTEVGRRLATSGDLVELFEFPEKGVYKYVNCLINYEPYKFFTFSKWNEKTFSKIKDEIKKSGKNMLFHFKKPIDFENFNQMMEKTLIKVKDARSYVVVDPQNIRRLEFPLER